MKALSIRQPWAWAIVNGYKPVENRTKDFVGAYRGPIAIHAGREAAETDIYHLKRMMEAAGFDPDDIPSLHAMPRGGFVGTATIAGVVRAHNSPFFVGPFGIVLTDAKPMTLVPWSGQLGLFNVDPVRLGLEPSSQGALL